MTARNFFSFLLCFYFRRCSDTKSDSWAVEFWQVKCAGPIPKQLLLVSSFYTSPVFPDTQQNVLQHFNFSFFFFFFKNCTDRSSLCGCKFFLNTLKQQRPVTEQHKLLIWAFGAMQKNRFPVCDANQLTGK